MGTRNLTMVIQKEKPVIAQYGQWDGYPTGQGRVVLEFLEQCNLPKFKKQLEHVRFRNKEDDKQIEEFLESIGCKDGWMNMDQSDLYRKQYQYLSRDIGADILNKVYNAKDEEIMLGDSSYFAADSLFCEWAYVIDLDNEMFEVYKGFINKPLGKNQRFKYLEKEMKPDDMYYPIRCAKKYKFEELPTREQFYKDFKCKEE